MKYKFVLFFLFSTVINIFGQDVAVLRHVCCFQDYPKEMLLSLERLGKNDEQILTNEEGDYFNFIFQDQLGGFDFKGKRVGFMTLNLSNKSDYFKSELDNYNKGVNGYGIPVYAFILNESERNKSGGYDALVLFWRKKLIDKDSAVKSILRYDKKISKKTRNS